VIASTLAFRKPREEAGRAAALWQHYALHAISAIHVGCGFCMRQKEYFRTFHVIEIQQTFYQPPQEATLRHWRQAVPRESEFALKALTPTVYGPRRLNHAGAVKTA